VSFLGSVAPGSIAEIGDMLSWTGGNKRLSDFERCGHLQHPSDAGDCVGNVVMGAWRVVDRIAASSRSSLRSKKRLHESRGGVMHDPLYVT